MLSRPVVQLDARHEGNMFDTAALYHAIGRHHQAQLQLSCLERITQRRSHRRRLWFRFRCVLEGAHDREDVRAEEGRFLNEVV